MAKYRLVTSRNKGFIPNHKVILALIPMFIIISSSVYPAITSSIENEEVKIISNVMAELKQNDNVDTSRYLAHMQELSSRTSIPSSSTPIDPTLSSSPSSSESSGNSTTIIRQQDEADDKMNVAAINPGDLLHVLWSGGGDILYKRDGADFDPSTVNLSNSPEISGSPSVAVLGNNVHVVWSELPPGEFEDDVFYKRSTDGGATFGPTINLSNSFGASLFPRIAVSGNIVHVVWFDNTPDSLHGEIFYRRSTDAGASFVEPVKNLSNSVETSSSAAIAVSGDNVHVVWQEIVESSSLIEIYYRKSTNGGSTFPNFITDVSNNDGFSVAPAIAAVGNNIHVVWADNAAGNRDIFYRRSTDAGVSFTEPIKNLSSNTGFSLDPKIAATGNFVHAVWEDDTSGNKEILYRKSLNGGATFPNVIKNLSGNSGFSSFVAIALSGTNVYVVWDDNTSGNFDILYRTSASNGDIFPPVFTNLTPNQESDASAPAIAVS